MEFRSFYLLNIIISFLLLFPGLRSNAAGTSGYEHRLIRKIAVLPIANANFANSEEAWWQIREVLNKDQRFLVATKRLLINRGAFLAKIDLKPADAIILAKIIDAHLIFVPSVKERQFLLKAYDAENGFLFWQSSEDFLPSQPVSEQIIAVGSKLAANFLSELPYHAFQIIDESIGRAVYEENHEMKAQIFIGNKAKAQVGDQAQWIRLRSLMSSGAFLGESARTEIIAEGIITEVKDDRAVVVIKGLISPDELIENSLVRLPQEAIRLSGKTQYDEKASNLATEYLSDQLKRPYEFKKDHDPVGTSLAWILNLAVFMLLAF